MNANNVLIWVSLFFLSGFIGDPAVQKVREGNRLFEKKEYGEALNRYKTAQTKRPDAPEIPFNIGNSFYRQRSFEEAIASHKRTLELDKGPLQSKAQYNIGNSLYRKGDLKGSLEAYKKAVDLDPNDLDTKYNIEFLQKKLKEEKEKQKPKPQQSSSQQKKEEPQPEEQKKEEQSSGNEQKETPKEISKKDAERILGALQSEEKSLSSPKKEGSRRPESDVEKDW